MPAAPEPLALASAGVWTVLALYSVRFIPLWALIVTPLLGEALVGCMRGGLGRRLLSDTGVSARLMLCVSWLGERARRLEATDALVGKGYWSALALLVVVLTVARGGALPGSSSAALSAQFDPHTFPVAAAQRLDHNGLPAGRGFTTFAWGGYLDYALPQYHVFIDSRSDVYSQQFLQDYADIIGLSPRWRTLLDRYDVRWALLPTAEPLAQVLSLAPGWHCSSADTAGVALLCVRGSAPAP